ncbi:hypothetical protein LTR78_001958 [Recurvomyces mirabilis]|uniref:RING-type domain-containing protein n=1 Tax=Recurvomyces mirabilis TaxID=574656 RepID=A0AAE0WU63_9PEZI|nr:hypothetical protein LTR78_001958 [Recurvomyces mirabilis]KAK5160416.1 hypothetical protein LTS14_001428 [Recurvomyces mirabilis]
MSRPNYTRPTVSALLKDKSSRATPVKLGTTGSRRESVAYKANFGITSDLTIAALVKMRKKCTSCERMLPLVQFPKHPQDSKCTHNRETCRRCWHQWVEVQVNSKRFDQVKCAQCDNALDQHEIKALATPAVFDR